MNGTMQAHSLDGKEQLGRGAVKTESLESDSSPMGLFTPQLYRSFAVGFALGALVLLGVMEGDARSQLAEKIVPSAVAASIK